MTPRDARRPSSAVPRRRRRGWSRRRGRAADPQVRARPRRDEFAGRRIEEFTPEVMAQLSKERTARALSEYTGQPEPGWFDQVLRAHRKVRSAFV